jgi:hypothetical protein
MLQLGSTHRGAITRVMPDMQSAIGAQRGREGVVQHEQSEEQTNTTTPV